MRTAARPTERQRACRAITAAAAVFAAASAMPLLAAPAAGGDRPAGGTVRLRSGVVDASRAGMAPTARPEEAARWVVRFLAPTGWPQRGALEAAGARIVAPLPDQAFLVDVPPGRAIALAKLPGVEWALPYLPQDKLAPEVGQAAGAADGSADVAIVVHLFPDADPKAVAVELSAAGLRVTGAGRGGRFGRIVLLASPEELRGPVAELARRNDVFWIGQRYRRTLANDNAIWVGQSGLNGAGATPVFARGIYGTGQVAAVLDTGLDADMCYFRDPVLGLPATNLGVGGTAVNPAHRKVLAVDFLWNADDPSNPAAWDSQGHGTHVAGTLAGDNPVNPLLHDTGDGHAPGARLVIQDAGYAADNCGDLPGIGCPVTDLNPVFQQAYTQGARVHSNSWNDNENGAVQNNYTDASADVDEFMWNHPDFLVVFACGNHALGGVGTMGSPSTAKNGVATGGTYNGQSASYLSDISAWGPTDDGRIKPDVVFPGASILSAGNDRNVTTNNCNTSGMTGTSMTAPGVSGMALLAREYFMNGWYPTGAPVPADGFTPTAALLKAMLVNSAVAIPYDAEGRSITIPSGQQGWGRVLLDNALHFAGDARGLWVADNAGNFTAPTNAPVIYQLQMDDTGEPLKVTLAWTDYPSTPAAAKDLLNDLDLRVDGPSGGFWGNVFFQGVSVDGGSPDRLNNLEQVLIPNPRPGVYSIQVSPSAIPAGPQPFALVVTGGRFTVTSGPQPSYWSHVVDDAAPRGNGDGVLDPGESAKLQVTLRNVGDAPATAVLGALFSANPGTLKVYDGSASFPDMAVGAQGSSAAPHYDVTLEPSMTCGQIVGATMNVSGSGFAASSAMTLDVGIYSKDYASTDTPLSIPRNSSSGANSYINVPVTFPLTEVDVTVNIDHANIGDLEVLLYRPGVNPPVYLHNKTQAGVSGIHTTYDDQTEPDGPGSLDDFAGSNPQGNWRLKITNAGNKTGTLQNWTLHLKSNVPFNCNPVGCAQGVPAPVGDTLAVARAGVNDVRLTWTSVGSADYNVWRSADAQFTAAAFAGASGGAPTLLDAGAQRLPGMHYYLVRSVNSCRWESP
jgi:subtilisin-like proprotein convertase family protein